MARTTLTYDDDINDWIEKRLIKGQNRTVWLRYALETTYAVDGMLDTLYEPYQYDERQEFVEMAIREKVDEIQSGETDMSHQNLVGDINSGNEDNH